MTPSLVLGLELAYWQETVIRVLLGLVALLLLTGGVSTIAGSAGLAAAFLGFASGAGGGGAGTSAATRAFWSA